MKVTYIQTEDGETRVEWWGKENFRGRLSSIHSLGKGLRPAELLHVIPIPDDTILCDFCNAKIEEFPVPVLWGTHALCKGCFEAVKKEGGEQHDG